MSILVIVQGRLAFPVFHIELRGQQVVELLVSLYHGGLHAVALLFAVATVVLSLAMRQRAYGPYIVALGIATAAFDVIGAYPWAIGLVLWLLSGVLFSAWFVLVGLSLYRTRERPGGCNRPLDVGAATACAGAAIVPQVAIPCTECDALIPTCKGFLAPAGSTSVALQAQVFSQTCPGPKGAAGTYRGARRISPDSQLNQ